MAIGKKPCPGCGGPLHRGSPLCKSCCDRGSQAILAGTTPSPIVTPQQAIAEDRRQAADRARYRALEVKYKESLDLLRHYEERADFITYANDGINTFDISPKLPSGAAEGTVVVAASDWHIEEKVTLEQTSGLNEATLDSMKRRITRFFQSTLRLTQLLRQDCHIDQMVMALLGDFITNDIHEEFAENNQLLPMPALIEAESWIISGLQFLLDESDLTITLPCHSGNHARTTKDSRFSTEYGHSLEYLMYTHLADRFRNEERLNFIIPKGYHSYVNVYDKVLRFHHGHNIRYSGGVGGIFIPAFKAIAQWNKARHADLDFFGHYHQSKDGGSFLSNGSGIGYNSFALGIKADYEKPQQTLTLIDKRRGRTCTWPILLE